MTTIFDQHQIIRQNASDLISKFSEEQIHKIPKGFKNNLIWNFGHMIVTQHILTFGLSNLSLLIDDEIISKYRKGSSPVIEESKNTVEDLQKVSEKLIDETKDAYNQNRFTNFNKYETSFKVTLNNIEDALAFNNIHEGLHLGYMMALSKNL